MLVGHLLCGLVVGWLAALVSFLSDYSFGGMLMIYVLGATLGVALSVLWMRGPQAELDRT
jgi:hypothetical protein